MATNRSKISGLSFVIMLPTVKRLWKHHQAAAEAVFSSAESARKTLERFSGRGALAGAKVMKITGPTEPGAIWHDGWWLVEV
jgi:hypothetical protein